MCRWLVHMPVLPCCTKCYHGQRIRELNRQPITALHPPLHLSGIQETKWIGLQSQMLIKHYFSSQQNSNNAIFSNYLLVMLLQAHFPGSMIFSNTWFDSTFPEAIEKALSYLQGTLYFPCTCWLSFTARGWFLPLHLIPSFCLSFFRGTYILSYFCPSRLGWTFQEPPESNRDFVSLT